MILVEVLVRVPVITNVYYSGRWHSKLFLNQLDEFSAHRKVRTRIRGKDTKQEPNVVWGALLRPRQVEAGLQQRVLVRAAGGLI